MAFQVRSSDLCGMGKMPQWGFHNWQQHEAVASSSLDKLTTQRKGKNKENQLTGQHGCETLQCKQRLNRYTFEESK